MGGAVGLRSLGGKRARVRVVIYEGEGKLYTLKSEDSFDWMSDLVAPEETFDVAEGSVYRIRQNRSFEGYVSLSYVCGFHHFSCLCTTSTTTRVCGCVH
jgi:hypothetical protein